MADETVPTRRLIVMRHAKSSWAETGQPDHDRPLKGRGRRDAPRVAEYLWRTGWCPDVVLSSDACRTRETYQLMQQQWTRYDVDIPVHFTRGLYLAGYRELLEEVAVVDDAIQALLVLGHNPGWEEVAETLCGEPIVLKTANAALLVAENGSWQQCLRQRGQWRLIEHLVSRDLSRKS